MYKIRIRENRTLTEHVLQDHDLLLFRTNTSHMHIGNVQEIVSGGRYGNIPTHLVLEHCYALRPVKERVSKDHEPQRLRVGGWRRTVEESHRVPIASLAFLRVGSCDTLADYVQTRQELKVYAPLIRSIPPTPEGYDLSKLLC